MPAAITSKDMDTLKIDKEKAINAYQQGSEEQKKVLEQLFGVETFRPADVTDRVKTFGDALKELKPFRPLVKEYKALCKADVTENMIAYSRLCIVTAALNEGWTPQFEKGECRYFPYFYLYTDEEIRKMSEEEKSRVVYRLYSVALAYGGVSGAVAYYDSAYVSTFGFRLAFKTKELAEYAGKQFIDMYADYLLKY